MKLSFKLLTRWFNKMLSLNSRLSTCNRWGFLEKRPCSNKLHPIDSVFSEPAAVPQKTPLLCRHGFYSTVLMCISVGTLGWDATESNGTVTGVIKVQHVPDNHSLRKKKKGTGRQIIFIFLFNPSDLIKNTTIPLFICIDIVCYTVCQPWSRQRQDFNVRHSTLYGAVN